MKKILLFTTLFTTLFMNSQIRQLDSLINPVNNYKITYLYNEDSKHIQTNEYELSNGDWIMITEKVINYDSEDRVSEIIEKYVTDGSLVNSKKKQYSYNSISNIETETIYNWDDGWIYDKEYNMLYNTNNFVSQRILPNNTKIEFIYDDSNYLITKEYYYWNITENQWNSYAERKYDYSYDEDQNRTETIKSNFYNGNWVEGEKQEYLYNNTFLENELILPYFDITDELNLSFNHMVTDLTYFEKEGGNWQNIGSLFFYYSDVTLNISESNHQINSIYPNPTKNQVKFEIKNFEYIDIYNSNGKLIKKTKSNIVNIAEFPNGVYLYKVFKGNKIIIGKIIKD